MQYVRLLTEVVGKSYVHNYIHEEGNLFETSSKNMTLMSLIVFSLPHLCVGNAAHTQKVHTKTHFYTTKSHSHTHIHARMHTHTKAKLLVIV